MRRAGIIMLGVLLLAVSTHTASAGEAAKIGVIDQQAVMDRSKAGKVALENAKNYSMARQKIINADEQELEDLQQRQAGGNPPTAEEMEAAREKIRTLDALQGKAKETRKRIEAMIEPNSDQASAGGATVIPASPQSSMLLTDRRAAIEEGRLITACKD